MADDPWVLPLEECRELRLAGGKAVNLARLIDAGFPVPDGFVVTTAAFRHVRERGGPNMPGELSEAIAAAYRELGSPAVAVRSSATAEDMAEASMAGQYETFLDVRGESSVLDAVERCWKSLDSQRTRSYLRQHDLDPNDLAMAVVVQRLVPAEVAGVLFTAHPQTGSRDEMLIEASWGLGEAVVSGLVQPDTIVVDWHSGAVRSFTAGEKAVSIEPGSRAQRPVSEEQRSAACLKSVHVFELWKLGLHVGRHFDSPQDIEWAIHDGGIYLLQSRAITTLESAQAYRRCLHKTRAQLGEWKNEGRGDWVRHNLSETLPHPTPLSFSVIRRFMSGDGGFGAMYRQIGFQPSPSVCEDGFLDLIAGRIYMDLSRGPEMFFEHFPFAYDVDLLRSNPDAAQGPPTIPAGSMLDRARVGRKLAAINRKLETLAEDCDRTLDERIVPAFVGWVREEKQRDLQGLSTEQWGEQWRSREGRVMDTFGPQILLPSLILGMAVERLRTFVEEHFWDDEPGELVNLLAAGDRPDQTLRANQALYEVAAGTRTLDDWLATYGHRTADEFDLATPRWRERPEAIETMASYLAGTASPVEMHRKRTADATGRVNDLGAKLSGKRREAFQRHVALVQRYLRFREDGKFYLMLGYDLLRDMALEAGRRLEIGRDVFLLTLDELHDALGNGLVPLHLIEQRRAARAAEARVVLPHMITEGDVATLGEATPSDGADRHAAFAISSGSCTGPVRIVHAPDAAGDLGKDYVLVCPSTDPNWTPLFAAAAGLVLECGGTLSHGAVVAREMGIPAVVLPGATKLLREGETVLVDGHHGAVVREDAAEASREIAAGDAVVGPEDGHVPWKLVPPPRGPRERKAAAIRSFFLAIWGLYLLAVFVLPPAWLYDPSIKLLDAVLWPLVVRLGKPAAVAILAASLAALTMIGQRLLTDNRRLRVARRRANRLRREAAKLPKDSPRAVAISQLTAGVQTRIVGAAFVPLAIILGPMIMSFVWLPARVDPASRNARPGAIVYVTVTVDGEYLQPITIRPDSALKLDRPQQASQSLPPIRSTLEKLQARWQQPSDLSGQPWEVRSAAMRTRRAMLDDLADYLDAGIPPQTLSWSIRTPPDLPGRFPVTLETEGADPICVHLVLGDLDPPEPKEDLGDGKGPVQFVRAESERSPLRSARVIYKGKEMQGDQSFWVPFKDLGWSNWDAGWLITYLAAYLLAMFPLRWVLRVA